MEERWGRSRTSFSACAWLATAILLWPAAALADSAPTSGVKPNHLGTVITGKEVFITWRTPAGVNVAHVYAYRAPTCQGASGTQVGPTVRARQIIDLTVTPGATYCYTIYVTDQAGTLTKVGSTGLITVPNPGAPPPAVAPTTPPPAQATAGSGSPSASTIAGIVAAVAGALLLLYLLARIVRQGRAAPSAPSPAYESPSRMAAVREQRPALIIPAVIVLAWVIVVTAAVVFR
jgi:hypothetical protein